MYSEEVLEKQNSSCISGYKTLSMYVDNDGYLRALLSSRRRTGRSTAAMKLTLVTQITLLPTKFHVNTYICGDLSPCYSTTLLHLT